MSTKLNISDLREQQGSPEKSKLRGKGSDDNMHARSEFMPPFPETNVKGSGQNVPDDEDKVYITGNMLKKNERLVGWRKARNRAWKG